MNAPRITGRAGPAQRQPRGHRAMILPISRRAPKPCAPVLFGIDFSSAPDVSAEVTMQNGKVISWRRLS